MEMDSTEAAVLVFQVDQVVVSPPPEPLSAPKLRNRVIFANELADLWQSQRFMDVDLICAGNQIVKAHKLVLAALSSFFRRIFMDIGPLTETDVSISLAEVEATVLNDLLQKVYLGDLSVACIDKSLDHLVFCGDVLNEPVRSSEAIHEVLQATIKTEPNAEDIAYEDFIRPSTDTDTLSFLSAPKKPKIEIEEDVSASRGKKSKVWNFYVRLEKDVSKCKACEMTIKTQKGNTSGMTRHLFRAHLDLYSQLEAMREKDADASVSGESDDDDDFSPFRGLSFKNKKKKVTKAPKKKPIVKKKPKILEFFDYETSSGEAKCKSCDVTIKTESASSSECVEHLKSNHAELYSQLNQDDKDAQGSSQQQAAVRNSPVWQFYEELGSNRVKCMKCNVVLKYYYGTTSGLLRHLRRSHVEAYESIKTDDNKDLSIAESALSTGAYEVDNETIWKFFHKTEGDKANCAECMVEIANEHGTLVTSCEEHLRASHTDILEQYESQRKAYVQELIKSDKTAIKRRYTSRVVASAIWSYFRKTENPAMNQCSTCLLEIDCSQNTTAMVRHLEEAHPEQHDSFKKQSGIEAKDIKKPSAIWKHFQATSDPKKNKCLACEKEILCHYQTTSNMIRHLEHNHTDLYEAFLRESHGLEQSEDVNPLLKKPKKRNLNKKGSNDPVDRTCPDCGKEYSCRPAMLFHYKCVHSGIRPYKCEECGMTFARQDSWKGHTHSKVRSFLCSICGKTFARRNIRDTHERAHLNDRRYPCSYCGKKFMTNQQRTNHERTHTGEKPFQCTDCGRQFAQQHQLTTHIRIHTGEKPYSCQHCGQKFRHLSSRNNHKCDGKPVGAGNLAGQVAAPASITVSWSN